MSTLSPEIIPVSNNPYSIRSIQINALFSQFTYKIPNDSTDPVSLANLMILYGDNGSGKTTILQLIMHLLSPEERGGHKTFVARTPFSRFLIQFHNGVVVEAKRERPALVGNFTAQISKDGNVVCSVEYRVDEKNTIVSNEIEDEHTSKFTNSLKELAISLYYLSDNRKFYEDIVVGQGRRRRRLVSKPQRPATWSSLLSFEGKKFIDPDSEPNVPPLEEAIKRVYEWARDQAYIGSGMGERNTNTIYNEVIRLVFASTTTDSEDAVPLQIPQLRETLQTLANRSREYSKFGLVTPLKLDDIIELISQPESISSDKLRIVYNVLKPFADGIEARLKALQSVHDTLQNFIETLNKFYKNKNFRFDVRHGLRIMQKKGEKLLEPRNLSSGEKQILLLFCNTIAAKDQATIFIIDEPEISLNVKWQRQLVHALLSFVSGSAIQFIMATHSIELLARHKHNVLPLENMID